MGGIMPPLARELHEENINNVVSEALQNANLSIDEVDAVAVTTKPGLKSSLFVGTNFGKQLCLKSGKPFIPIHHMQAHALTARMIHEVEFPFLVLLISGGHCLLSVAQSPVNFLLLGYSLNDAPGEALDKTARRLMLRHIPELRNFCGGEAVERAAAKGNPEAIHITVPLLQYRDCNFSFAGLKQAAYQHIVYQEKKCGIAGGALIPDAYDLCASFLHTITVHLCQRVQRAMMFVKMNNLIPTSKQTLVVSGGVACNNYIRRGLDIVATHMDYKLVVPPPKLCTDNGVMVAWNGIEKLRVQSDIVTPAELDSISVEQRSLIGEDLTQSVSDAFIKVKWVKLNKLYKDNSTTQEKESSVNSIIK
ncbi:threonyl-carbamoyl synthesis 4 isoform X2 [Lycorma delicatula]